MKRTVKQLLTIASLLAMMACKKDPGGQPEHPVKAHKQAVMVYMAANNNLRSEALASVNQMETQAHGLAGPLLVYLKNSTESSHLLRIRYDTSDRIISDTIKSYGDENSSDPAFMKQVLADAQALEPAESYGLILWSHGTSWAPAEKVLLKSFGLDRGNEMDIHDLKAALPDNLTYLIFDACSMASIEVIYELKDKASYILASPTETLAESYPYAEIAPLLFGGESQLQQVAEKFVQYYRAKQGVYQSATVSLIKTEALPQLAAEAAYLIEKEKARSTVDITQIQRLDFDPNSRVPAYDLMSFLQARYGQAACVPAETQLASAVLYKDHTDAFIGKPIHSFSGLSCYIPASADEKMMYYTTLSWGQASGFNHLF